MRIDANSVSVGRLALAGSYVNSLLTIVTPGFSLAESIHTRKIIACLSGYHPHPLYVVCLLGLQARAAAGALRRRSG